MPPDEIDAIIRLAGNLQAAQFYVVAVIALLFYDIFTTIDVEVEVFWTGKNWYPARFLWFLHRYYNIAIFIIIAVSFLLPEWTTIAFVLCEQYKHFPYSATLVSQFIISVILILRTFALYAKSKTILATLIVTELASLSLQIYPLHDNTNIPLPPGLVGCVITGSPESGITMITFHIGIALFDSVVFILTLYKTMAARNHGMRIPLLGLLRRDGAIYYFIITASNLLMIFTYAFAEPSLKSLHCVYAHVIAVILVSHLMLNLKAEASRQSAIIGSSVRPPTGSSFRARSNTSGPNTTTTSQTRSTRRDTISEAEEGRYIDLYIVSTSSHGTVGKKVENGVVATTPV